MHQKLEIKENKNDGDVLVVLLTNGITVYGRALHHHDLSLGLKSGCKYYMNDKN